MVGWQCAANCQGQRYSLDQCRLGFLSVLLPHRTPLGQVAVYRVAADPVRTRVSGHGAWLAKQLALGQACRYQQ